MASPPFALSIHKFISSVGADAGFASIIGLAILILLYFAHARETSALRQEAALLADRLQDAEARLAQALRSGTSVAAPPRVTPAPAGAASPRPAFASPAAAMGAVHTPGTSPPAPGAPAGVGAPALAAATRFVPVAAAIPRAPLQVPEPQTVAAARAHTAGSSSAASTAAAPAASSPASAPAAPAVAPARAGERERQEPDFAQPATVAGAAAAAAPRSSPIPAPAGASRPGNGAGGPAAARPLPPRSASRTPSYAPVHGGPARLSAGGHRRRGWPRGAVAVIAVIAVVAVIAALLVATSGSGTQSRHSSTRATNAPKRVTPFNPATVTVAVLNGTAVNHLAHETAARLAAKGYREGTVATASDQTLTATIVGYLPGHRADALQVARSLGLGPASVQPVSQANDQVACQSTGPCSADVVVTVGADLANG